MASNNPCLRERVSGAPYAEATRYAGPADDVWGDALRSMGPAGEGRGGRGLGSVGVGGRSGARGGGGGGGGGGNEGVGSHGGETQTNNGGGGGGGGGGVRGEIEAGDVRVSVATAGVRNPGEDLTGAAGWYDGEVDGRCDPLVLDDDDDDDDEDDEDDDDGAWLR